MVTTQTHELEVTFEDAVLPCDGKRQGHPTYAILTEYYTAQIGFSGCAKRLWRVIATGIATLLTVIAIAHKNTMHHLYAIA